MAFVVRCRRSLILKVIIFVPILWFLTLLLISHGPLFSFGKTFQNIHELNAKLPESGEDHNNGHNPDVHPNKTRLSLKDHDAVGGFGQHVKRTKSAVNNRVNNDVEDQRNRKKRISKVDDAVLEHVPEKSVEAKVDPNAPGK